MLIKQNKLPNFQVWRGSFEGHFADWKNKLTEYCSGDYTFQIDAVEMPHKECIETLPMLLTLNPDVDVMLVPRINTVEGLTCLLYTSPSPRDRTRSRMPSSA